MENKMINNKSKDILKAIISLLLPLMIVLSMLYLYNFFDTSSANIFAAEKKNVKIIDDAGLLKKGERKALLNKLNKMSKKYSYLIFTTNEKTLSIHKQAEEFYRDNFEDDSGVIFLVNMGEREIYLAANKDAKKLIKNKDALDVTDNCYRYAKKGNFYECLNHAFSDIDSLLNHRGIIRTMRYVVGILFGLILGFFSMFLWMAFSRKISLPEGKVLTKGIIPLKYHTTASIAGTIAGVATGIIISKELSDKEKGSSFGGGFGGGGSFGGGGGGMSGGGHSF